MSPMMTPSLASLSLGNTNDIDVHPLCLRNQPCTDPLLPCLKGTTKHKNDPPPGWSMRTNRVGDKEYVSPDGRYYQRSLSMAWKTYQRTQRQQPEDDRSFEIIASDDPFCTKIEAYGSISKELQRQRILFDMRDYRCRLTHSRTKPALVFLASPDGSDTQFFSNELAAIPSLADTKIVAINGGPITRREGTERVEFRDHTNLETFMNNSQTNSFSHGWLDLTENEVGTQLLFDSSRVCTDYVYVVQSLRTVQYADAITVMNAQCEAAGLRMRHSENYVGVSNRRNMLFVSLQRVREPRPYDDEFNRVGMLIDMPAAHMNVAEGLVPPMVYDWHSTPYYVGFVLDYDPVKKMYQVSFYDARCKLYQSKKRVPASCDVGNFFRAYSLNALHNGVRLE